MKRSTRRLLLTCAALYLAFHGASHLWFRFVEPTVARAVVLVPLDEERAPLARALEAVLAEDGVAEARAWAEAIVRHAPTTDAGYLALVAAQIRRESHFLQQDLEWLFDRAVPDLAHELGLPNPVRTIGPMQIMRRTLRALVLRDTGESPSEHGLEAEVLSIDRGVRYCILHLDAIVRLYVEDRRVRGHADLAGPAGYAVDDERFHGAAPGAEALRAAALQKMLSDLRDEALVLDGVLGERTRAAAREVLGATLPDDQLLEPVRDLWKRRYALGPPRALHPRLSHDPRLAFVFADFNAGRGASRIAALQHMLNELDGAGLRADGKCGPLTRAALLRFLERRVADPRRLADFRRLLEQNHKGRWVRDQVARMARAEWRATRGTPPPEAICPDLEHESLAHRVKGIGRMSVRQYVAGSVQHFERYHRRLCERLAAGL